MRYLRQIVFFLVFKIPFHSFSQTSELLSFLNHYKSIEFNESKDSVLKYNLYHSIKYDISTVGEFSGIFFNCDTLNLNGYKALGVCKLKTKGGSYEEKKMIVVMYFDKAKNHWVVFDFRPSIDPEHELKQAIANIEYYDKFSSREFSYRSVAYWALMAGKPGISYKYINMAIEFAKTSKSDIPFSAKEITEPLSVILK